MSDLYTEEIVKRKKSAKEGLLKVLLITGTVLAFLFFLTGIIGWFGMLILLGFVAADYILIPGLDLEFEYLYVNGEIDIDKIMSKQRRKRVFSGDMANVEKLAPSASHELDPYRNRQDIKKEDYSSHAENAKTYSMVIKTEKGMKFVIFEPNETMLRYMKRIAPREVSLY